MTVRYGGLQANPTPTLPHRGRGLFGWQFSIGVLQANPTPALSHGTGEGNSFVTSAACGFTYTTSAQLYVNISTYRPRCSQSC